MVVYDKTDEDWVIVSEKIPIYWDITVFYVGGEELWEDYGNGFGTTPIKLDRLQLTPRQRRDLEEDMDTWFS